MRKDNNTKSSFDQEAINEVQDLFQEYIVGKIKSDITHLEDKTKELDEKFDSKFQNPLLTAADFSSKSDTIKKESLSELTDALDERKNELNTCIETNLSSLKGVLTKISENSKEISTVLTVLDKNEKNQHEFITLRDKITTVQTQLNDGLKEYTAQLSESIDKYSKSTNDSIKENALEKSIQLSGQLENLSKELSMIDEKIQQQQGFSQETLLPKIQNNANKIDESISGITKNFSDVIDGSTEKILAEMSHVRKIIDEVNKNIEQYATLNKEFNDKSLVFMNDVKRNFNELNVTKKENTESMKRILFWVFVLFGLNISISIALLIILLIK